MAEFNAWPDDMPLEDQVTRLALVLVEFYPDDFERSEGAIEMAARLLWERAHADG